MIDPSIYRQLADLEERLRRLEALEAEAFVGARYTSNAAQSIPNATYTVVDYEDIDYDPLGLVTTGAAWVFTCPIAGRYLVTAAALFDASAAWSATEVARFDVYQNGAVAAVLDFYTAEASGVNQYVRMGGSEIVECNAGDTLQVRIYQSTGGVLPLINLTEHNHIAVARVG